MNSSAGPLFQNCRYCWDRSAAAMKRWVLLLFALHITRTHSSPHDHLGCRWPSAKGNEATEWCNISCGLLFPIRIKKGRGHVVSLCINSTSFDETVSLTKTISANAMQQSNSDVEEAATLCRWRQFSPWFERMINSSFPTKEAWLKEFVLMCMVLILIELFLFCPVVYARYP